MGVTAREEEGEGMGVRDGRGVVALRELLPEVLGRSLERNVLMSVG